jgi:hypothetical protein
MGPLESMDADTMIPGGELDGGLNGTVAAVPVMAPAPQTQPQQTGVEIAASASASASASPNSALNGEDDLGLGDEIEIQSTRYGRTHGKVYYRDANLIRVMPEGSSSTLIDFNIVDSDFDPELGVTEATPGQKARLPTFVAQQDLRAGYIMETVTEDGEVGPTYTIRDVNEEDDSIVAVDEEGAPLQISFMGADYIGIPRDLPFAIIRAREPPSAVPAEPIAALAEEEAEAEATAAAANAQLGENGEVIEGEFDFDIVGTVEVPILQEIEEEPEYARVYSEVVQKNDALNDFFERLTSKEQKDERALRRIRTLVEMLNSLKKDVILYSEDGFPIGIKPTSIQMIADLFQSAAVPLGRPVLDSSLRVYDVDLAKMQTGKEFYLSDDMKYIPPSFIVDTFSYSFAGTDPLALDVEDYIDNNAAMQKSIEDAMTGGTTDEIGGKESQKYWIWQKNFEQMYGRPWTAKDGVGEQFIPQEDTEFFRTELPDLDTSTLPGLNKGPIEGDVQYSMRRALSTTYYKTERRQDRLLHEAEAAIIKNYILFPLSTAAQLGTTRTGSLATDSASSHLPPRTMREVLATHEGITEVPRADAVLAIGVNGTTIGNIAIADYLASLNFGGLGLGSLQTTLKQFGLDAFELDGELMNVLQKKLDASHLALKVYIKGLRDEMTRLSSERREPFNATLFDAVPAFMDAVRGVPTLNEDLATFAKSAPNMKANDIAQIAALMKAHPDLFMAAASGQKATVNRETMIAARDSFLNSLRIAKAINRLDAMKGKAPEVNKCEHVKLLEDIRKTRDDAERYLLLTRFLVKYQDILKDGFATCKICHLNLLCQHEILQIQQFIHPKDAQVLGKEIALKYNGPLMGGHYICKNCGQSIAELDFDKNLEFDDEGKPMMGRAVLVDEDALTQEAVEEAIGKAIHKEEELDFGSDGANDLYKIIHEIGSRIGFFPEREGYKKIIERIQIFLGTLKSREQYAADIARLKAMPGIRPEQLAALLEYDVYLNRNKVCAAAAHILIEIQTHTPDYIIRYTLPGCQPSFLGFPLGPIEDKSGIIYLACAVATIFKNEAPWNLTGFMKERKDTIRQQAVGMQILKITDEEKKKNAMIQHLIELKKDYLSKTYGAAAAEGRPRDILPAGFLPQAMIPTDAEAAAEPIMANTPHASAALWLRTAHKIARKTATLLRGNPFSETSCCPSLLASPGSFWQSVSDMPQLQPRKLQPMGRTQKIQTHFAPRQPQQLLADTPEDVYYRLFLKVCYRGPRKGLQHELTSQYKCIWCDFQFPSSLQVLSDQIEHTGLSKGDEKALAASRQKQRADAEREAAELFRGQGVDINAAAFQDVLNASHIAYHVEPYVLPTLPSRLEKLAALSEISPAPAADWAELIDATVQGLAKLPPDADDIQVAIQLGPISTAAEEAQQHLAARLGKYNNTIMKMADLSIQNFLEAVLSYLIVPFKRLLTAFSPQTHLSVPKSWGLATSHVEDIKTFIRANEDILHKFGQLIQGTRSAFARAKLQHYIDQMAAIYAAAKPLTVNNVPGGAETIKYLVAYLLYVPLDLLLDSNITPPEYTEEISSGQVSGSAKLMLDIIAATLDRYGKELLSYDDRRLREAIENRNELEVNKFIRDNEKLSKDMKQLDKLQKKLGIGHWAIGGTSAIYSYDPDAYDHNREELIAMGYTAFDTLGPDGAGAEAAQRGEADYFGEDGFMNYGEAYEGDGYDHAQDTEENF